MVNATTTAINRAVGLLIIEVRESNPNGDPDLEGEPRQRAHDEKGWISGVSFKRKLRDLVGDKEGVVWGGLADGLNPEEFEILESRGRERKQIDALLKSSFDGFKEKFWDGRVFGNTFLEKEGGDTMRSGVVQVGTGLSVAPVRIQRATQTNKAGVQEGKDRGMAPLGFRVVEHGVYVMPFFVNPTAAPKSGCTARDIELMLRLIPYAYSHTASAARPAVELRHAWYIEHKSPLGSCSDFKLLDALQPRKKSDPGAPSAVWDDYDIPTDVGELRSKVGDFRDLMDQL